MASKLASSSAARTVFSQGMRYLMTWLSNSAKPSDRKKRRIDEHIAQLGLNQENTMRIQSQQPSFEYATIMTGIHYSSQKQKNADPDPHVTLRVATSDMRLRKESIVLHARVQSQDNPIYIGSEAYPDPTPDGNAQRISYLNPGPKAKYDQVRSSLFFEDDPESTPVGCVVFEDQTKWYVVDSSGNLNFLPEGRDGKFFRAGEGEDEHLRFWDPLKNRTSRAVFLGVERPNATSPQQSPYDAMVEGVSKLQLQTLKEDKGKKAETVLGTLADGSWSKWIWEEQLKRYVSSRKKPDGTLEYDYGPVDTPNTSFPYPKSTTQAEPEGAQSTATLQSSLCIYVKVKSMSQTGGEYYYRCALPQGKDIEIRGWYQSTINYQGNAVPCWAYTGKSGTVYYTWNLDV